MTDAERHEKALALLEEAFTMQIGAIKTLHESGEKACEALNELADYQTLKDIADDPNGFSTQPEGMTQRHFEIITSTMLTVFELQDAKMKLVNTLEKSIAEKCWRHSDRYGIMMHLRDNALKARVQEVVEILINPDMPLNAKFFGGGGWYDRNKGNDGG